MAAGGIREAVVVAASEIMVKGGYRPRLERMLVKNIAAALRGRGVSVYRKQARIIVEAKRPGELEELAERVSRVPGVRWARVGYIMPRDYELLMRIAEDTVREHRYTRIAVEASRSDKSFHKTSLEISREIGERLMNSLGVEVDLRSPETVLWVGVLNDAFLFAWRRIDGVGGLPVGSSGRVIALLSGGIDSPVAAWMMMKRGCLVDMLHIYAQPTPQDVLTEKMGELYRRLREISPASRLFLATYHNFLSYSAEAKPRLELALFRRFMFRLADALARETGAKAIVAGDSLGQVASQTIESIHAASHGLSLPVLLPLVGFDKEEIIRLSQKLGLFEISIRDYKDCCSIVSRHPLPRPKPGDVEAEWMRLGMDDVLAKTLQEVYVFNGERLEYWKNISIGRRRIRQE
ncbi:MAG: tRNA 4-thiouridine(8) synthase ThiI [Aigarchaeota archaeon]|nr:tRNA 4-thiouridine(8) synthase ThiI [Candidatus Calditenuaceae archaeon]